MTPAAHPHPTLSPARTSAAWLFPLASTLALLAAVAWVCLAVPDPLRRRAGMIAAACLVLWLTELVPLYATTLLLWAACVLFLAPLDPKAFALPRVLAAANNPVIVLCFGGFALSAVGARHGVDAWVARWVLRLSGGRRRALLAAVMLATAVLSMWMLNIAAAAMMIATLRPLFRTTTADATAAADPSPDDRAFRTALLVGLAMAANFGGVATPIGTGPNLVAIAAVSPRFPISFPQWMLLGVPVAAAMLAMAYALILALHRVRGRLTPTALPPPRPLTAQGYAVVAIFTGTVLAWLAEPAHHVPAAAVALAMTATLFATRLLTAADLRDFGWDTLILIAGGLSLGQLFDDAGLARAVADAVHWHALSPTLLLLGLVVASATISAVASNTAAAAILIQIAAGVPGSSPQTTVLIALGASMGVPLVISTPPNAMAYGERHIRPRDLLAPGLILMTAGCILLALLGPALLRAAGIP